MCVGILKMEKIFNIVKFFRIDIDRCVDREMRAKNSVSGDIPYMLLKVV